MILSLVIVIVIALELGAVYAFWYTNLQPETIQANGDSIVRVDLPGYQSVIRLLDNLIVYEPNNSAAELGNPFLYR